MITFSSRQEAFTAVSDSPLTNRKLGVLERRVPGQWQSLPELQPAVTTGTTTGGRV